MADLSSIVEQVTGKETIKGKPNAGTHVDYLLTCDEEEEGAGSNIIGRRCGAVGEQESLEQSTNLYQLYVQYTYRERFQRYLTSTSNAVWTSMPFKLTHNDVQSGSRLKINDEEQIFATLHQYVFVMITIVSAACCTAGLL